MILLRWLTFLLGSLTVALAVLLFFIHFYLLMLVFVLQWLSLLWEILIMLLSRFPLTFHQTQNKTGYPISLYDYSCAVLDGLQDMFQRIISLSSVLLLLLVNFLSWLRLELMYISFIVSIRSSLISTVFSCLCCCHSYRNHFFVFINRINLLNLQ